MGKFKEAMKTIGIGALEGLANNVGGGLIGGGILPGIARGLVDKFGKKEDDVSEVGSPFKSMLVKNSNYTNPSSRFKLEY